MHKLNYALNENFDQLYVQILGHIAALVRPYMNGLILLREQHNKQQKNARRLKTITATHYDVK